MLFSETAFLFLFLPALLLLYVVTPQRFRNALLLVASLLFYATGEATFLPFLLGSIALNYYFALWIARARGRPAATWLLWLGIASDLGLLLWFKYAGFLAGSLHSLLTIIRPHAPPFALGAIALPLGISFFTFHKISYKVDVYRGHAAAKRNPLELALYILFFPQLIAGPIVRFNEIADQLGPHARRLDWPRFAAGVRLFIIGLSKKMLIANIVALPADRIFAIDPTELPASVAWLGLICYALQIYFDFSGYSDMAVGLAALFGCDFPRNFRYPYCADSITDFWRRWHISLSTWFRDYLYIPLGGNRLSAARTYANLLIVFLLCGLWHGAAWTFVIWGLWHGAFLVLERACGLRADPRPGLPRRLYTLLVVLIGWVFFRASTLPAAGHFLTALTGLNHVRARVHHLTLYADAQVALAIFLGLLASTPLFPALTARLGERTPSTLVWKESAILGALFLGLFLSLLCVVAGTYSPFIYYRF